MRISILMLCNAGIFFLALNANNASADIKQPKHPQLTAEQSARIAESELKSTELKIGNDCQPKSFATKMYLKTLSESGIKYFWLGQRYAVQRTYQEMRESDRITAINRSADEKIAVIENQRDLALLSAAGIKPYEDPAINRAIAENDRLLSGMERNLIKSNYDWAKKCYQYADERSR